MSITKLPIGARIDWAHALSRNVASRHLFNQGGGQRVEDIAGNCSGSVINGTATWTSVGQYGSAMSFSNGPYLDCGTGSSTQDLVLGPSTIIVWSRRNTTSGSTFSLLGRNDNNAGNQGWGIGEASGAADTSVNIKQVWSSTNPSITVSVPGVGTPYMLAYINPAAGSTASSWKVYVDGVQKATTVQTAGAGTQGSDATQHLYIGNAQFVGSLSIRDFYQVITYKRVLSADEIRWLYNEPFAGLIAPVARKYFTITTPLTDYGAVTLRAFQANGAGAVSPTSGTSAVTLRAFTASGIGAVPESGTADVTLRAFTCAAQGTSAGGSGSKLGMLLGVG